MGSHNAVSYQLQTSLVPNKTNTPFWLEECTMTNGDGPEIASREKDDSI